MISRMGVITAIPIHFAIFFINDIVLTLQIYDISTKYASFLVKNVLVIFQIRYAMAYFHG